MRLRQRWLNGLLAIALGLLMSLVGLPSLAQQDVSLALNQGKAQYDQGRYAAAVAQFHQAAQGAKGGSLQQAQALGFQARAEQHLGHWKTAEALVAEAMAVVTGDRPPRTSLEARLLAQLHNTQGQIAFTQGHADLALEAWKLAEQHYAEVDATEGILGSRVNQVQAMQSLGFYRQAGQLLQRIADELQQQQDSVLKLRGLLTLGNTLQRNGEVEQAQQVLSTGLDLAEQLSAEDLSRLRLSLGNGERLLAKRAAATQQSSKVAREHRQRAISLYQQASAGSALQDVQVQAQLNQLALLLESQQFADAQRLWPQLAQTLAELPAKRASTDARVNLA